MILTDVYYLKNKIKKKQFFVVQLFFLQLFSEKISGAEGTKLDEEFQEMERVRKTTCVFQHSAIAEKGKQCT